MTLSQEGRAQALQVRRVHHHQIHFLQAEPVRLAQGSQPLLQHQEPHLELRRRQELERVWELEVQH